jgi:hypothetical protein
MNTCMFYEWIEIVHSQDWTLDPLASLAFRGKPRGGAVPRGETHTNNLTVTPVKRARGEGGWGLGGTPRTPPPHPTPGCFAQI